MYDSQNLPLSPLKVVKKTIRRWLFWALFVLPFLYLSISSWYGISMFGVAFLLLLPIMFVIVIYEYYYYKLYYYNFAEDRAEIRKGVISRATGHVHYERLQNIYIDQDFLDRIFRLYDIHYETAGKTSDFYSHVDGLNKINADKLAEFLNGKAKIFDSDKSGSGSSASSLAPSMTNNEKNQSEPIEISRENCPISPTIVIVRTMTITIVTYFVLAFLAVVVFIPIYDLAKSNWHEGYILLPVLSIILPPFLGYLYEKIRYKNFFFCFTQDKGEIRYKVFGQSTSYLYYDRIQNINLRQSIFERVFGIYTLRIETAGEQSGLFFELNGFKHADAEKLRDFLMAKAKHYQGRI